MAGNPASPCPGEENVITRAAKASDELPDAVNLRELPPEKLTALGRSVQASVRNQVQNRQDAEDLTQDAFIKWLKKNDIHSPSSWLRRVATRAGITLGLRKRREKRALEQRFYLDQALVCDDPITEEEMAKVDDAISQLEPQQWNVVMRRLSKENHKESYKDIGEALGVSATTARNYFLKACGQLRRLLEAAE